MAPKTDSTRFWSEEAAHWWTLLHGEGATAADRREFLAWVSRSPERIEAYLGMERLMAALQSRQVQWPDTPAETLIRDAKSSPETASVAAIFPGSRQMLSAGASTAESGRVRWKGLRSGVSLGAVAAAIAALALTLW